MLCSSCKKAGIEVHAMAQQVMLDAREIKSQDEIVLLEPVAAAMVDGTSIR